VSLEQAARETPAKADPEGLLDELTTAIESGAGLPAVTRAAAKALGGSAAVIDRSSAVLGVAAPSQAEEGKLLAGDGAVRIELRVADTVVGELRYRARGEPPTPSVARMVSTLLALEVERSRSPEWASDEAAAAFVRALLDRQVTDRGDIVARAAELGAAIETGAGVIVARAAPFAAQSGDWRGRVLTVAMRAVRSAGAGSVGALGKGEVAEVVAIVPASEDGQLARAAQALERELAAALSGFGITVARSRLAEDPVDLYRAGKEAELAANVAEAEGRSMLAFEDTGAYRLLLPAMSEDPGELERFYQETLQPLAAYDEQYETDLVTTVETYLENDGNVAQTAASLFTHRHTVRYRLERVKELTGHDIGSSEGREKLSLGLKAMRVLGIASAAGPATEPGAEGGRVRPPADD
jgi:PucR family transcriptional regulator, purine catabolism regulatory protein